MESKGADLPIPVTDSLRAQVESAVRGVMKDPESARFDAMMAAQASSGTIYACGLVNGKNSFGGYVGDRPYFVVVNSDGYAEASIAGAENSVAAHRIVCRQHNLPI